MRSEQLTLATHHFSQVSNLWAQWTDEADKLKKEKIEKEKTPEYREYEAALEREKKKTEKSTSSTTSTAAAGTPQTKIFRTIHLFSFLQKSSRKFVWGRNAQHFFFKRRNNLTIYFQKKNRQGELKYKLLIMSRKKISWILKCQIAGATGSGGPGDSSQAPAPASAPVRRPTIPTTARRYDPDSDEERENYARSMPALFDIYRLS